MQIDEKKKKRQTRTSETEFIETCLNLPSVTIAVHSLTEARAEKALPHILFIVLLLRLSLDYYRSHHIPTVLAHADSIRNIAVQHWECRNVYVHGEQ